MCARSTHKMPDVPLCSLHAFHASLDCPLLPQQKAAGIMQGGRAGGLARASSQEEMLSLDWSIWPDREALPWGTACHMALGFSNRALTQGLSVPCDHLTLPRRGVTQRQGIW